MQRRRVLRGLAALAAGVAAGCTGANREVPVTAPDPPVAVHDAGSDGGSDAGGDGSDGAGAETSEPPRFVVPERSFEATEDGDLLIVLTVENRSETLHEATMTVIVTAGDKRFSPVESVALDPGASTERRVVVPVPYSEFDADPGFDVQFAPGSPATPLPEGTVTPYPEDRETATAEPTGTGESTGTEPTPATDSVAATEANSTAAE